MNEWTLGRDFPGRMTSAPTWQRRERPCYRDPTLFPELFPCKMGRGTRLIEIIECTPLFFIITSNKTIITVVLVGYEMIIAKEALRATLVE